MSNRMNVELESLSNEMFAPLSEKEASLVVGGMAQVIAVCGYDTTITWSGGGTSDDFLIVDTISVQ